jgi:cytochrome c-type biogenesis protein CcmH
VKHSFTARATGGHGLRRARGAARARRLLVALPLLVCLSALAGAAQAGARLDMEVALPALERQMMCVTCKVALNESQSPQADAEREYIKELIQKGDGEAEIRTAMVAQYGPTVLAVPGTNGFDLMVYLVPALVVLALGTVLALLLPRWRRRARVPRLAGAAGAATLSPDDAARLETDIARFD